MEYKRDEDKTVWGRFTNPLLRIRTEITLIFICSVCLFALHQVGGLPKEAVIGVASLFITKILAISVGTLIAHSTRKYFFPFMDLQVLLRDRDWPGVIFLTVWYAVIIWACATGG
jgi:hypothetical protein